MLNAEMRGDPDREEHTPEDQEVFCCFRQAELENFDRQEGDRRYRPQDLEYRREQVVDKTVMAGDNVNNGADLGAEQITDDLPRQV